MKRLIVLLTFCATMANAQLVTGDYLNTLRNLDTLSIRAYVMRVLDEARSRDTTAMRAFAMTVAHESVAVIPHLPAGGTINQYVMGNGQLGTFPVLKGYCLNVQAASQSTTTDGQTLYWGGMLAAPSTTANRWRVYIPKDGTIKAAYIYSYAGTAGTNEAWVMNIRLNNTSDTQIASVSAATNDRTWSNTGLNISVVAGDYIEIKEAYPTQATNSATVTRTGQIYIE